MKYLVVLAHPYTGSFGRGIVDTIEKEVLKNGSEIRIRDLYEIGFNPTLQSLDLINLQTGDYAVDIKEEQEHIEWADIITFVYPVWWAGLPAMLKGYVDRVFANGFAFTHNESGPLGLLKGKKAILFCTTGFASDYYDQIGMHRSMQQTSDEAIFKFCGIDVIKHVFFGSVPSSTEDDRKKYLREVEEVIRENC